MIQGEIDSAQYHNPGRFRKIQITWQNLNQNRKYFNPLVNDSGRLEWGKNLGRNSRWTIPLKNCDKLEDATRNFQRLLIIKSTWIVRSVNINSRLQHGFHVKSGAKNTWDFMRCFFPKSHRRTSWDLRGNFGQCTKQRRDTTAENYPWIVKLGLFKNVY